MSYQPIDARLEDIAKELLSNGITLEQATDAFERKLVSTALQRKDGNVTAASKDLGVHRNTLHNKLRAFGWLSHQSVRRQVLVERRKCRR